MKWRWVRSGLVSLLLGACGATPASVCRDQCRKRQACGANINLSACDTACSARGVEARSQPCIDADLLFEQCQVQLSCAEYLGGGGCEAQAQRAQTACR